MICVWFYIFEMFIKKPPVSSCNIIYNVHGGGGVGEMRGGCEIECIYKAARSCVLQ